MENLNENKQLPDWIIFLYRVLMIIFVAVVAYGYIYICKVMWGNSTHGI